MTGYSKATIDIPISAGDRITLLEDPDIDSEEGMSASILFEGYVNRYNPDTALLEFEESEVGRAEFRRLLDESDGIEVVSP